MRHYPITWSVFVEQDMIWNHSLWKESLSGKFFSKNLKVWWQWLWRHQASCTNFTSIPFESSPALHLKPAILIQVENAIKQLALLVFGYVVFHIVCSVRVWNFVSLQWMLLGTYLYRLAKGFRVLIFDFLCSIPIWLNLLLFGNWCSLWLEQRFDVL